MAQSIQDSPKKRGRPSTGGRNPGVLVRLEPELIEQIDRWRDNALGQPSRPEAIRRLAKKGLHDDGDK